MKDNGEKLAQNFPSVKQTSKDDKNLNKKREKSTKKFKNGVIIGLAVTTGLLGVSMLGLSVAVGVTASKVEDYGNRLEAVYQKSFYDLIDNVNNAEIKLSKVIASNTQSYQKKLLAQVAENADAAQSSFSALPVTQSSLNDSVQLLNQISGYTKTLNEKLSSGQSLTLQEIETLDKLHSVLAQIKAQLNTISAKMQNGYNILDNSLNLGTDNNFTLNLSQIKSIDVQYPTMIYDGPFSDSVVNANVKGLSGQKVGKKEVRKNIEKLFKNIVSLDFEQDTLGRFETYNYRLKTSDNTMLYVQATQIGGHVLTVSGASGNDGEVTVDMPTAATLAIDFAKQNGISNPYIVWTDQIDSQGYFNIAPTQNGIILYPDLVKVKVDLNSGTIIGYDATTYFTNHVQRDLQQATYPMDKARSSIPQEFVIKSERTVLAPLDYNREVLCYEFACQKEDDEYYFYLNAENGDTENILRVIKTDQGNKLL